ncbi:6-bladed beta-propeller [Gemmatimonadota bacterium]
MSDDGRLFVLDSRAMSIHIFSNEGEHLSSFGREGRGPGEFSMFLSGYVLSDRLILWNGGNQALMQFDLAGNYISERRLPGYSWAHDPVPFVFQDGLRYLLRRTSTEMNNAYIEVHTLDNEFKKAHAVIDTVIRPTTVLIGGRETTHPYSANDLLVATRPDLPVVYAYPTDYRICFEDVWRENTWEVNIPREPHPVTQQHRESTIQRYQRRNLEEEARRRLKFPPTLPIISNLSWSTDGRLWIRLFPAAAGEVDVFEYDVFSSEGYWLFRQTLPEMPSLITENGYYASVQSESGEPLIMFRPWYSSIRED